ncbi:phage tail assembly chaperone [Pseudomonas tussilaginis]|uniref:phage tail assembly chaperone n=1 Tax=Pseudomonas putida TaxID=303 RepID=UPI0023648827|nr:phage tail assembly chaperone [Pseudomonas putida]MDD1979007.1 phage tail assembly chaperone [Pseudomonas putida]
MARGKAAESSLRSKALDPLCNFKHEPVAVPEWGESVIVRALSAGDWLDYRQRTSTLIAEAREAAGVADTEVSDDVTGLDIPVARLYALVLVRTLFDSSRVRVFDDDDVDVVAGAFSPVHDLLVAKAFELSGAVAEQDPETVAGNG